MHSFTFLRVFLTAAVALSGLVAAAPLGSLTVSCGSNQELVDGICKAIQSRRDVNNEICFSQIPQIGCPTGTKPSRGLCCFSTSSKRGIPGTVGELDPLIPDVRCPSGLAAEVTGLCYEVITMGEQVVDESGLKRSLLDPAVDATNVVGIQKGEIPDGSEDMVGDNDPEGDNDDGEGYADEGEGNPVAEAEDIEDSMDSA